MPDLCCYKSRKSLYSSAEPAITVLYFSEDKKDQENKVTKNVLS